jgi:hypothetical protein
MATKRWQTLLLGASLVLYCDNARAERTRVGFIGDLAQGVSIPVADSQYTSYADPSYKISFRFGVEFPLLPRLHIAPELSLDVIPVNTDDDRFQRLGVDARFNRVRLLFGARLIIPFGNVERPIGDFFARIGIGLDYTAGSLTVLGNVTNTSSTGFAFEPGFGVDFRVFRVLYLGASLGFPIGTAAFTNNLGNFTAVDFDVMFFVGVHTL